MTSIHSLVPGDVHGLNKTNGRHMGDDRKIWQEKKSDEKKRYATSSESLYSRRKERLLLLEKVV